MSFYCIHPESKIVSVISMRITSLQHPILEKIDGMTSETMMLLWTMREKHNHESKFKPYFDSLQESFCTGKKKPSSCTFVLKERTNIDSLYRFEFWG